MKHAPVRVFLTSRFPTGEGLLPPGVSLVTSHPSVRGVSGHASLHGVVGGGEVAVGPGGGQGVGLAMVWGSIRPAAVHSTGRRVGHPETVMLGELL